MRCTSPRTVSQAAEGQPLNWRKKQYNGKDRVFQLPCGKCIDCRLEYSRSMAVRCVHEAKMHEQNCFITLTYSEENLKCPRLDYRDFQLFMKKLRFHYPNQEIGFKVTGEYGELNKRPHWHALIFGWRPSDLVPLYKNENGDQLYKSEILDKLWGKNDPEVKPNEVGQLDFKSAAYVMRYAAKKLVHGNDQDHDYHPISRGSCKYAIGKKFLEKHFTDIFNHGYVVIDGGVQVPIPRYYEKWFKENHPTLWETYVTEIKLPRIRAAEAEEKEEKEKENIINHERLDQRKPLQISKHKVRSRITEEKFKRLQQFLKGDI